MKVESKRQLNQQISSKCSSSITPINLQNQHSNPRLSTIHSYASVLWNTSVWISRMVTDRKVFAECDERYLLNVLCTQEAAVYSCDHYSQNTNQCHG
jgi:hypothetical protein